MGLQNQLNDVASDSIPVILLVIIANCVSYLRSLLLTILQFLGLYQFHQPDVDDGSLGSMGSGLAGFIVLAEQLNLNRIFSHRYSVGDDSINGSDCVVCLSTLMEGDQVRKLACRHVFHKECFDRWLDQLHFNCPLCRTPVISDERVANTERRVGEDIITWFALQ